MTGLRIVFAGTPEFAVPALKALLASTHQVTGVLTQPDRPQGRGRRILPTPIKQLAQANDIPVLQPSTLRADEASSWLRAQALDALIVVAYGLILPPRVLGLPRLGCINIHASLLPRWRGAAPVQRAILAGDAETGITIMQMDEGLDTGPALLQRRVAIARETAGELQARLAELGARALLDVLDGLPGGTVRPTPQSDSGVTYARKIEKGDGVIDWNCSATEIDRRIRAFNPWPIAETRFEGEALKVFLSRPSGDAAAAPPGTVTAVADDAIVVCCGEGSLGITQLQRPGRKVVSARDFAHSRKLVGCRFGPASDPPLSPPA
ncbi:MAG TPA: methionyl-tRNA formyltransferase [Steroidobacteraceae bacterium]|nr:methionyl-tRNA formyltransferase [Steroidobacteraceae bacterium]